MYLKYFRKHINLFQNGDEKASISSVPERRCFYTIGDLNNDNASFIDDLGSVSVQYNANSSITSLVRRGQLDYGYGAIDNLSFTYLGNQVTRISENVPPILHEGSFDFKDNVLNVSGSEYLYDACGSLTADANKGNTEKKEKVEN